MKGRLVVIRSMSFEQAKKIVRTYCETLGTGKLIADEQQLPCAKPVIKQALLMVMPFAPRQLRQELVYAYVALADFQPGVGDEPISRPGPSDPLEQDPDMAGFAAQLERTLPWIQRSADEYRQLVQELKDAGFMAE